MSASLVGSEMCIRDRCSTRSSRWPCPPWPTRSPLLAHAVIERPATRQALRARFRFGSRLANSATVFARSWRGSAQR
eukprot:14451511-Alexandrium_andersonii.AAC.1